MMRGQARRLKRMKVAGAELPISSGAWNAVAHHPRASDDAHDAAVRGPMDVLTKLTPSTGIHIPIIGHGDVDHL